jgi:hypothetical protein
LRMLLQVSHLCMPGTIANPSRYLEELRRQRQVDLTCGSQVWRTEFCWSGITWSIQGYSVVLRRIPFDAIACHGEPCRKLWRNLAIWCLSGHPLPCFVWCHQW